MKSISPPPPPPLTLSVVAVIVQSTPLRLLPLFVITLSAGRGRVNKRVSSLNPSNPNTAVGRNASRLNAIFQTLPFALISYLTLSTVNVQNLHPQREDCPTHPNPPPLHINAPLSKLLAFYGITKYPRALYTISVLFCV